MFSAVGQPPERIKNVHKISMKVKHCCLNKFYKKVMTHHILQLSNNNLVIDGLISFGCVSTQSTILMSLLVFAGEKEGEKEECRNQRRS